jgi:hypothetical protein
MTPGPKRKNDMRWEQGRMLLSKVAPTLPTPSHVAVLMVCWFHGSGRACRFSVANCQIAAATKLSLSSVKRIMADLINGGVIETKKDSIGRGFACERVVTGNSYAPKKGIASDTRNQKRGITSDTKGYYQ